jgi:hypothetical protein
MELAPWMPCTIQCWNSPASEAVNKLVDPDLYRKRILRILIHGSLLQIRTWVQYSIVKRVLSNK